MKQEKVSTIIGSSDLQDKIYDKRELEMKMQKINSFLQNVENRINAHQTKLNERQDIDEKQRTKDQIDKLTRQILEQS